MNFVSLWGLFSGFKLALNLYVYEDNLLRRIDKCLSLSRSLKPIIFTYIF